MKLFLQITVTALISTACLQQATRSDKLDAKAEKVAIREVLAKQQTAWNAGNIPGFMDGYVHTKKLRFASGGTFRFGWETTLKKYQDGYPNKQAMGQLTFSDLHVQVLSNEWAEVFGRWELKRGGEFEDIGGLYTLLMQRTKAGWRVLHDHTSSRPPADDMKK
ncbi:MAG: DUF4440 domain-containing protein [Planctomycetaceae bacterium]